MKKKSFLIAQIVLSLSLLSFAAFAAGEVDSTFNAQAYRGANGSVTKIVRQPDGKFLVAGNF